MHDRLSVDNNSIIIYNFMFGLTYFVLKTTLKVKIKISDLKIELRFTFLTIIVMSIC